MRNPQKSEAPDKQCDTYLFRTCPRLARLGRTRHDTPHQGHPFVSGQTRAAPGQSAHAGT